MASEQTRIADLFTPGVWIPGVREAMATMPSLFNSPAVIKGPEFDQIASGPGIAVDIPFFKDITDTDDAIQVEDTAPETKKVTTGRQAAPILNRVTPFDHTGLSRQVAGIGAVGDPVQETLNQLGDARLKQRQKTLISILRGLFGTALAANSVGVVLETTAGQTATHLIAASKIIDAAAVLGEKIGSLSGCRLVAHSQIIAALRKQDENNFIPASQNGTLGLDTYKGCPIIYCDALVRAGTTSGFVFDSYLLAPGLVGYGEQPQGTEIGTTSHLVMEGSAAKNNLTLYDRTRFLLHVRGTKWKGTPAGQSATNAELAVAGNWELAYSSANRVPVARILSNG